MCSSIDHQISESLKTTENFKFKPWDRENGNLDQYSGLEMKEPLLKKVKFSEFDQSIKGWLFKSANRDTVFEK